MFHGLDIHRKYSCLVNFACAGIFMVSHHTLNQTVIDTYCRIIEFVFNLAQLSGSYDE